MRSSCVPARISVTATGLFEALLGTNRAEYFNCSCSPKIDDILALNLPVGNQSAGYVLLTMSSNTHIGIVETGVIEPSAMSLESPRGVRFGAPLPSHASLRSLTARLLPCFLPQPHSGGF